MALKIWMMTTLASSSEYFPPLEKNSHNIIWLKGSSSVNIRTPAIWVANCGKGRLVWCRFYRVIWNFGQCLNWIWSHLDVIPFQNIQSKSTMAIGIGGKWLINVSARCSLKLLCHSKHSKMDKSSIRPIIQISFDLHHVQIRTKGQTSNQILMLEVPWKYPI